MSQAEFKKARKRLVQVKQNIRCIHLHNIWHSTPETSLKEYNKLSQQERQQLYQECLAEMQEILLLFMQELSKRVHIHVESEIDVIGPDGPPPFTPATERGVLCEGHKQRCYRENKGYCQFNCIKRDKQYFDHQLLILAETRAYGLHAA